MKQTIVILFLLTIAFTATEKECREFYEYEPNDRENILARVKEASLLEGNIVVSHLYFENDDPNTIIKKIHTMSECYQEKKDSLNAQLSKTYLSRLYYRIGDFNKVKKIIEELDNWLWDVKGSELEQNDKVLGLNQIISDIKEKLFNEIQNNSSDFKTLTIGITSYGKVTRQVPEGLLVNQKGKQISMSILLPQNGDFIFSDPVKKKRFMYIKNNITSLTFNHINEKGSHDMQIDFLPILPDGKHYTFLIKDELNGRLFRYQANFSKYEQDDINITFFEKWMIKLSAPEGKIKVWLPVSRQYDISIEDNTGSKEKDVLSVNDNQTEYNVYLLESMRDKDAEYDYKIIYEDKIETEQTYFQRWGWRWIFVVITSMVIANQMDT